MTPKKILAQVEQIEPLTDSIIRLILKPEEYVAYHAGQYLQIQIGEELLSYSIANAPLGSHQYELHIRHTPNNLHSSQLLNELREKGAVLISLPYGDCSIETLHSQKPLIFIAGGTGFAPVNAMIEQLLVSDDDRPFELYWGARSQSDLYLHEKVLQWATHVSRFTYYPFISEGSKESLASQVLKHHPNDLTDWQMILGGPFDMIYLTRDILVSHGVPSSEIFSDAFSFEAKS